MNIITTNAAKTGHKIMARKLSRMELNQFTAALAEGAPKTAMGNNNPATATMDIFLYSDSNNNFFIKVTYICHRHKSRYRNRYLRYKQIPSFHRLQAPTPAQPKQ